jgi:hypothetical protein
MLKESVKLNPCIRMPDGSHPYIHPAKTKNHKLKAKYLLINGVEHYHPECVYTLCWRQDGRPAYETIADSSG